MLALAQHATPEVVIVDCALGVEATQSMAPLDQLFLPETEALPAIVVTIVFSAVAAAAVAPRLPGAGQQALIATRNRGCR